MSHHEQNFQAATTKADTEQGVLGLALNRFGNYLKPVGRRVTGAAAATVLAITLAGCGVSATEGPTNDDKATSAPSPEATQTPEAPSVPAIVTELEALSFDTFNDGDANEIRAYSMYRIETNAENHAAMLEGKNRPTWTEPSIDMSGQQILDNWQYVLDEARMATKFDAQSEDHYLDHDEAQKILGAAYYDIHDGTVTNSYISVRDDILSRTDGYVISDEVKNEVSTSELKDGSDQAGNAMKYKDVTYTNRDGETQTARFVFAEFEDAEGEPAGDWLLLQQN